MGIANEEDYQVVFSDTPGVVNSAYKLHDNMMSYVSSTFQDADILLFITDIFENEMNHVETLERIRKIEVPKLILINKMDLGDQARVAERLAYWSEKVPGAKIFPISALHGFGVEGIWEEILANLPESPAYYDKEELSDRPMRFFISEMIREKIFIHTKKEVPYACQVVVDDYIVEEDITRIRATIIVERDTQKGIIIGNKGTMLKRIGREARLDIEKFIDHRVFLETFVKVDKDWRSDEKKLKKYGY